MIIYKLPARIAAVNFAVEIGYDRVVVQGLMVEVEHEVEEKIALKFGALRVDDGYRIRHTTNQ